MYKPKFTVLKNIVILQRWHEIFNLQKTSKSYALPSLLLLGGGHTACSMEIPRSTHTAKFVLRKLSKFRDKIKNDLL